MKVTATMLANDSQSILDQVIIKGQKDVVKRRGKSVVKLQRRPGASAKEMLASLSRNPFTAEESDELMAAIKEGTRALTHGHGH